MANLALQLRNPVPLPERAAANDGLEEPSSVRTEQLALLGTLAGGIGHEMNNLLQAYTAVEGFIEQRALEGKPPLLEDIAELRRIGEHFMTHARDLLTLAQPPKERRETVDLAKLIQQVVNVVERCGYSKTVTIETPCTFAPVNVTPKRIEQVLLNLLKNAIDAIARSGSRKGRVVISLRRNNGRVTCTIADNGCGMTDADLALAFEPYFTTKRSRGGTGLGLSVSRDIVRSHGGRLSVSSRPNQGTQFGFELPLAHDPTL